MVRDLAREHPDKVVIAVDAKDGFVATDGWTQGDAGPCGGPS